MKKNNTVRILARSLARELSHQELADVSGRGTSYYGTGSMDLEGRREDLTAGDCTGGVDRYYPYA